MAGAFNEYKLNSGKISFNNATVRQGYRELTKDVEDTAKDIAVFQKKQLEDLNAGIQKVSP
jgi:hypothetical protein